MASIDKAATPVGQHGQGPIQLNGDWYVPQLPVGAPLRVARPQQVLARASATMGFSYPTLPMRQTCRRHLWRCTVLTIQVACWDVTHYGQIDLQRIGQRLGYDPRSMCVSATAVVRSTDGLTCPLGTEPVFVLFQPTDVAHRYTMDAELYQLLQRVSGYRGEGLGWCACGPPTAEVSR